MQTRVIVLAGSVLAALFWVGLLSLLWPPGAERGDEFLADLLLDRASERYPLTIQNLMWIVFFVGAGELFVRYVTSSEEARQFELRLLPQDDETLLDLEDLRPIYRRAKQTDPDARHWLQSLLATGIAQYEASRSVDQVNAVFSASMDLYQHELDLRYQMLRYVVWLIPTLGFIGTVVGIALALSEAGAVFANIGPDDNFAQQGPALMGNLTGTLGVAFHTTLLALLQAAALMLVMHLVQGREEGALNRAGQYCLKNFINRLHRQGS